MNFLFITKDDHILFQNVGEYPIREHPHHGMYVKDGSTSKYDWKGYLKSSEKLSIADPEKGYVVTANNKPSEIFKDGIVDISIYTARADRLEQMVKEVINSGKKITKDDMKRMQADTVDVYCMELVKSMKIKMSKEKERYEKVFG